MRAAGVVPQQQADALAVGVGDQVVDRAVLHPVPVGVHQRVLPAHLRRQIDPGLELGAILRAVVIEQPAPGGPSRLDPARVLHDGRRTDIRHEGRFDDVGRRVAEHDHPPRRRPGQRPRGFHRRRCRPLRPAREIESGTRPAARSVPAGSRNRTRPAPPRSPVPSGCDRQCRTAPGTPSRTRCSKACRRPRR